MRRAPALVWFAFLSLMVLSGGPVLGADGGAPQEEGLPPGDSAPQTSGTPPGSGGEEEPSGEQRASMPFTTIAAGQQAAFDEPHTEVIRSRARWKEIWARIVANRIPPPDLPEVDFTRRMLVAVFAGQRPSGGYSVRVTDIERIEQGEPRINVYYRVESPDPRQMVPTVLTSPYHVVAIADSELPVDFHRQDQERSRRSRLSRLCFSGEPGR